MNTPCNTKLLSVILHQKEGLNFFELLVSDRKQKFNFVLNDKVIKLYFEKCLLS